MLRCCGPLRAVKTVKFNYVPTVEMLSLLEKFRCMTNDALRIGFEKKPRSRFQLITMAYSDLKDRYGLHTHYILSACECAFAMLRNRKWRKQPYARRLFLKLDNETYKLDYMLLRIPTTPRNFIHIPLRGGEYQLSFLCDPTLKRGSITITENSVVLAISKETEEPKPLRAVAFDVNEKNATSSDSERYDLSDIANIKHQYSRLRASITKNTHNDRRIKQKFLSKYGRRERQRTVQALHRISKEIVRKAKESRSRIVLEKLTNIRQSARRGNGQGRKLRGRLNRWSFHELQKQIEYKAAWEGVPVEYVRASNTSKRCSQCGSINRALRFEKCWICPTCGVQHDRDYNAALNILARSRFKEAAMVQRSDEGLAGEGMAQLETVTRC